MAYVKTGKILTLALIFIVAFSIMLTLSVSGVSAVAEPGDTYIDIDLSLENGTGVYTGAGINVVADVWQSADKLDWTSSVFADYEIEYYSGISKLLSAPTDVGTYTAKAVSTYTGTGYQNTSDQTITSGMVLKTLTYKIIYNHFAVSYITPASLIADGGDHILELGASVYCEGATLVEDTDYEINIYFEGVLTAEVINVGLYTIEVKMLTDLATSNVQINDTFNYEFNMVSTAVTASLEDDNLYYTGETVAPVLEGNITGVDFTDKFDVYYVKQICNSANGYRLSATAPIDEGDYIYRIVFNTDIAAYGIDTGDHIDLPFTIQPKPYKVIYEGDGATFDSNNAIVEQNESGMTLTAEFTTLTDQIINTITSADYDITYFHFDEIDDMFKDLPYVGYNYEIPTGVGRYKIELQFNRDIQSVFGAAHPDYIIHEDDIISYEFQIVNPVQYLVGKTFNYTGSAVEINPLLTYQSTPIVNTPMLTQYEVKYYYDGIENTTAPTEVGEYVGIVRFLENYIQSGNTVAEAGDEYRFYFEVCYNAPIITISSNEGVFSVTCENKATFVEDTDYSIETYLFKNGFYYITEDMTGVGAYRCIVTIINEDKVNGLLLGDVYQKMITVQGGNPEAIALTVSNYTYTGRAKPVSVNFGTGVTRTLNEDYTITYFDYINDVINAECGYPVLPGKYRAILTFNKEDLYFGVSSGYQRIFDYTISPIELVVTFTPDETDLVYDKTEKYFVASFTANNRPITIDALDYDINYRSVESTDYADFSSTSYINAGSYKVAVVFNADEDYRKYGINIAENEYVKEQTFTIQVLSLGVNFVLPVEVESMYRVGGLEPEIEFYKTNNGQNVLTDVPIRNTDYVLSYKYGDLLGVSYEEDPIAGVPEDTGRYLTTMSFFGDNIEIGNVSTETFGGLPDNDYDDICYADYQNNKSATAVYRIIPLPLTISADFPVNMYEDGTPKGCSADSLDLTTIDVNSGVAGVYDDLTVSNDTFLTDNLMSVEYFKRQSGGTAVIGSALAETPVLAGDYTLRVKFARSEGETEPYVFSCYYIKNGMNSYGEPTELSIHTGFYYDISYRIDESEELRVIFDKPSSFAYDGEPKVFDVRFACGDVEIEFVKDTDYEIKYPNSGNPDEPYTEVDDNYRVEIKFLQNFPQYKIVQYEGEYAKYNTDIDTITQYDVVIYYFRIFNPVVLDWEWIEPQSLNYNGLSKNYSIRFFNSNNIDSTVTLIYNIDYAIRYYKQVGSVYSLLTSAPSSPVSGVDTYVVELVFLRGLPDYRVLKYNDETKYVINSYVYAKTLKDEGAINPIGLSIQDNAGSLTSEIQNENRHVTFDIQKGVLLVSGLSIQDKSFDNTKTATVSGTPTLSIKNDVSGNPLGGMVLDGAGKFIYQLESELTVEFASVKVGQGIAVNIIDGYQLSSDGNDYYILEYLPFEADINKLNIAIQPVSTPRQYNPFYVDADNLTFSISDQATAILADTLGTTEAEVLAAAFKGALTRVGAGGVNDNVGEYNILMGTLAVKPQDVTLSDESLSTLQDNVTLSLIAGKYRILPREITITVDDDQYKHYGDDNPQEYTYSITSGSLLFNDRFIGIATRQTNEGSGAKDRIGFYTISLNGIRIYDRNGEGVDVTSNYNITRVTKPFEIKKKTLLITPNNQNITYGTGAFQSQSVKVNNVTVQPSNIYSILKGDTFAGNLGLEDTGLRTETIARQYKITLGTLCIRNSSNSDVTYNYNLVFDTSTTAYYTIYKQNIMVKINDSAVLTKYYGDPDPKIAFEIVGTPLADKYTFAASSSLSRLAGETAASYDILNTNVAEKIKILENGVNVTSYFNVQVNNRNDQNDVIQFVILPREITVRVKSESVVKTNKTIIPTIEYIDEDNKELSESIKASHTVSYIVPDTTFVEGENVITPVITGEITEDANFSVTIASGIITVIYPENTLSHDEVVEDDIVFNNNKIVYSDFKVFNSVKMYQFNTDNGEAPSRSVQASIPVTEDLMGKKIYVLAVYQDGSINLLNATVVEDEIVFEDNNFYYVLVGTVAAWPYVVFGIVVFLLVAGVATMLITHFKRRKKRIAAGLIQPKERKKKTKTKTAKVLPKTTANTNMEDETTEAMLDEENDTIEFNPETKDSENKSEEIITSVKNRLDSFDDADEVIDQKTTNVLSDEADAIEAIEPTETATENEQIITSSNTRRFDSDEPENEGDSGDDLL